MGNKITASYQLCSLFSASTPGGFFWTWDTSNKYCYVKSSNSGRRALGHAISGNKCATCTVEDRIDYDGNDITNKVTASYLMCSQFCAATSGGLFWTWDKSNKYCYVKSSNSGRKAVGHAISGNKCAPCTVEDGIHYSGTDITAKITASYQECSQFCASKGGLFWTWSTNNNYCKVKSDIWGKREADDATSG